jgi:hypothetical protein
MSIALKIVKQFTNDHFIQGEKLTGHVYLEIDSPIKNIHAIVLILTGVEQVQLGKSFLNFFSKNLTEPENVFLQKLYVPWQSKKKYNQLNTGIFKFPYQITFPEEAIPSSFHCKNFKIKYTLQCVLITSDHHFFHYETLREVQHLPNLIENSIDICVCGCEVARDKLQGYLYEKKNIMKNVMSKNISFIFKLGKMCITLISNRFVYFDGEEVDLSIIVSNGTFSKSKSFIVELTRKYDYYDHNFNLINTELTVLDSQSCDELIDSSSRFEKRTNVIIPNNTLESTLISDLTIQRSYFVSEIFN